jgi:hypothetical protein
VISSSPENAGRSSKFRVKSPCSPQAVGDAEADAEVLLDVVVVLPEEEVAISVDDRLSDGIDDDSVDETACELCVKELRPEDVGTAGPFARKLPIEVKAWVLGTTEVRLAIAKAVGELEAVMLPTEDIGETLLAVLVLVLEEGILVPAAPASEDPVPEGTVVPASRLGVNAVEMVDTIDEAFEEEPALELRADGVADSGEMPALLAVALGVETLLEEVDMRPVAGSVMPRTGRVTDSGDVMAPLGAVAALEAGLIPSVPGIMVGNDEEPSTSVIIELGALVTDAMLLRDVESDSDIGGTVGVEPEAWE